MPVTTQSVDTVPSDAARTDGRSKTSPLQQGLNVKSGKLGRGASLLGGAARGTSGAAAKVKITKALSGVARAFDMGGVVEHAGRLGRALRCVESEGVRLVHVLFDDNGESRALPITQLGAVAPPPSALSGLPRAQTQGTPLLGALESQLAGGMPPEDDAAAEDEWEAEEVHGDLIASVVCAVLGEPQKRADGRRRREWARLNLLLFSVPLCAAALLCGWGDGCVFILAFLGIVPLAGMLGDFTDDLSGHVGSTLGALLNASFGNATELLICIFAIRKDLFHVIKNSMLGSVMGNMLLVLGCAFVARSIDNPRRPAAQNGSPLWDFNADAANIMGGLLLLSSFTLAIPTAFAQLHLPAAAVSVAVGADDGGDSLDAQHPQDRAIFGVSRVSAVFIIIGYVTYLYFQVSHSDVFDKAADKEGDEEGDGAGEAAEKGDDGDDDGGEETRYSFAFDIGGLAVCTVLIALLSEWLVDALQPATVQLGLNEAWVAVILLPIVGNAAEHATGVTSAWRGDMEIALGVAVGSSIQIAGFLVPVLVLVSWAVNGHAPTPLTIKTGEHAGEKLMCGERQCPGGLDLNFHPFSMCCMLLSVIVVNRITEDGRGSSLEGACLLLAYCVIGGAFWGIPADSNA